MSKIYEKVIYDGVKPQYINKVYPEHLLVWVLGSGGDDNRSGSFQLLMQYKSKKEYYEGSVNGATANQAAIAGVDFAIDKIKSPVRIYVITKVPLGFKKGSSNYSLTKPILEKVEAKGNGLTEVVCTGMGYSFEKYIVENSKEEIIHKRFEEKQKERKEKAKEHMESVKREVRKELLNEVVEILYSENVDELVIDRIKLLF